MHIGKRIREVLDQSGHNVSWLAAQIGSERSNVYNIFRRDNIDSELLCHISVAMGHDFFADLSAEFAERLAAAEADCVGDGEPAEGTEPPAAPGGEH